MILPDVLNFGFFFVLDRTESTQLYFTAFLQGLLESGSHRIVVAEVADYACETRKITYEVESAAIEMQGDGELERLCRVAVSQFIDGAIAIGCLPMVLPLQLAKLPWTGEVMPFELTVPLE
jgi:hypothetical protein